jgi:hypothetical protein
VVALVVHSEPPGAEVRISRLRRTWTTPCEIADASIRRGYLDVTIALDGYETVMRRVGYDGGIPAQIDVRLTAHAGVILVREVPPGASVLLLRMPVELKGATTVASLFSQDESSLRHALEKLDPSDARFAFPRLVELAEGGPESIRPLAREMVRSEGVSAGSVEIAHQAVADAQGEVRFSSIPVTWNLALLVTRAGSSDFVQTAIRADHRQMVTLVLPRPPVPPSELSQARISLKGTGDRIRISAGGKVVTEVLSKPNEVVQLTLPREKVLVEILDARTGAVVQWFEMVPEGDPVPPGFADPDRLGKVQLAHKIYGVYLKLEPGQEIGRGDVVAIYRDGQEIGRVKVVRVLTADRSYPSGAAQLAKEGVVLYKGDEARRVK